MPEGPEIRQAADVLAKALVNRAVKEVFFAFEHLKPYESKLAGSKVVAVQPQGKAMLLHFEHQLCIYSHNQLYGKWVIAKAYSYPNTTRQLRLAIHNEQKSALLYSASEIEVLSQAQIATHPFLSQLGPDVLDQSVTVEQISQRFQDQRFRRRLLTSLLLDQHFLCGLGNYLRSEVLFVARVHPVCRPADCYPDQIDRLAAAIISVTHQSYVTKGITNNLDLVARLREQGCSRSEYRHYVFNRQGLPCFMCSTTIVKAFTGGRRYYYCPGCQS